MLPYHRLEQWLDPTEKEVSKFDDLLIPNIPYELIAQQIDKPSSYQVISDEIIIGRD
jgi:hypothetical protein